MSPERLIEIIQNSHEFAREQIIEYSLEKDNLDELKKEAKERGAENIVALIDKKQ